MKSAGLIIIVVGVIMMLYTGLYHDTANVSMNMGDLDVSMHSQENPNWRPYIWIGVMVVGVVVLMFGGRKSRTT